MKEGKNPSEYDKCIHQKCGKSIGDRISDKVAGIYGSWKFILTISSIFILWITWNSVSFLPHFDGFPFILLNLFLSFIAGYTGSFLQMSANRQAARDRAIFEHNYKISKLNVAENQNLQKEIDEIKKMLQRSIETRNPLN